MVNTFEISSAYRSEINGPDRHVSKDEREDAVVIGWAKGNFFAGERPGRPETLVVEGDAAVVIDRTNDGSATVVERLHDWAERARARPVAVGGDREIEGVVRAIVVIQQSLITPTGLAFVRSCIDGIRGLAFGFASMGRSTRPVVLYSVAR